MSETQNNDPIARQRELVYLVLQLASQLEKTDDEAAKAVCVSARNYVRRFGLDPTTVNVQHTADTGIEHAKDRELASLKTSLAAIHCMCLHAPGGVDLPVIAEECEHAIPALKMLRGKKDSRRESVRAGLQPDVRAFPPERVRAIAAASGIEIRQRWWSSAPQMAQLTRFAALAAGLSTEQPAGVSA